MTNKYQSIAHLVSPLHASAEKNRHLNKCDFNKKNTNEKNGKIENNYFSMHLRSKKSEADNRDGSMMDKKIIGNNRFIIDNSQNNSVKRNAINKFIAIHKLNKSYLITKNFGFQHNFKNASIGADNQGILSPHKASNNHISEYHNNLRLLKQKKPAKYLNKLNISIIRQISGETISAMKKKSVFSRQDSSSIHSDGRRRPERSAARGLQGNYINKLQKNNDFPLQNIYFHDFFAIDSCYPQFTAQIARLYDENSKFGPENYNDSRISPLTSSGIQCDLDKELDYQYAEMLRIFASNKGQLTSQEVGNNAYSGKFDDIMKLADEKNALVANTLENISAEDSILANANNIIGSEKNANLASLYLNNNSLFHASDIFNHEKTANLSAEHAKNAHFLESIQPEILGHMQNAKGAYISEASNTAGPTLFQGAMTMKAQAMLNRKASETPAQQSEPSLFAAAAQRDDEFEADNIDNIDASSLLSLRDQSWQRGERFGGEDHHHAVAVTNIAASTKSEEDYQYNSNIINLIEDIREKIAQQNAFSSKIALEIENHFLGKVKISYTQNYGEGLVKFICSNSETAKIIAHNKERILANLRNTKKINVLSAEEDLAPEDVASSKHNMHESDCNVLI